MLLRIDMPEPTHLMIARSNEADNDVKHQIEVVSQPTEANRAVNKRVCRALIKGHEMFTHSGEDDFLLCHGSNVSPIVAPT